MTSLLLFKYVDYPLFCVGVKTER